MKHIAAMLQLWLNGKRVSAQKVRDDYEMKEFDPMTGGWRTEKGVLCSESLDGRKYEILRMSSFGARDDEWDVPANHVFVMGDNRDNSMDSRSFGAVPESSVVGHVAVLWMSMGPEGVRWDRIGQMVR